MQTGRRESVTSGGQKLLRINRRGGQDASSITGQVLGKKSEIHDPVADQPAIEAFCPVVQGDPDEDSGKLASDPRRHAGSVSTEPRPAAIAGCDAGILDLDALPGPPPAQHVGIYSPSAADGKRTEREPQAPQSAEQSVLNGLPGALSLPTPFQTAQPPVQMARAIYEHKAERYDELSFLPGELLTILGPGQDQGWMHATNQRMAKGLIPHNYVQMLPGPTPAPSVTQQALVQSNRLSHSTESSPASIHSGRMCLQPRYEFKSYLQPQEPFRPNDSFKLKRYRRQPEYH